MAGDGQSREHPASQFRTQKLGNQKQQHHLLDVQILSAQTQSDLREDKRDSDLCLTRPQGILTCAWVWFRVKGGEGVLQRLGGDNEGRTNGGRSTVDCGGKTNPIF